MAPVRFSHEGRQMIVMPIRPEADPAQPAAASADPPAATNTYGGGAALITAGKNKTFSTAEWLHRQVAHFATKIPAPEIPPATNERRHTMNDRLEVLTREGVLINVSVRYCAAAGRVVVAARSAS